MKLRTRILIVVVAVIIYLNIGHLFAYYGMYAKYFPKSTTTKILTPVSPLMAGSPFNDNTPDVIALEGYSDFTTYYQKNLCERYLLIAFWPLVLAAFYIITLLSWVGVGVYWVITGGLLKWLSLLP